MRQASLDSKTSPSGRAFTWISTPIADRLATDYASIGPNPTDIADSLRLLRDLADSADASTDSPTAGGTRLTVVLLYAQTS